MNVKEAIKRLIPDVIYIKWLYRKKLGRKLNLKKPVTLNEKVQWLKLYNHNMEYIKLVDKYSVKEYVKNILGEKYIIPTLGVWDNFEDIDFDVLPEQFVLKSTHDSGGVVICKDRNSFDVHKAAKIINNSLNRNYYWGCREWPYKYVKPRIIAEKYMEDKSERELKDYKILCFNGIPQNIMVCTGRLENNVKYYFFDRNWNFLRYNYGDDELPKNFTLNKPENLKEMFQISEILSRNFKLVRVDLYEVDSQVYFGELTFYPDSGFDNDITLETDKLLGEALFIDCRKS